MDELRELRQELRLQAQAQDLLVRLTRDLEKGTQPLADGVLAAGREFFPGASNLVLFLDQQEPLAYQVGDPQRLQEAKLLGLHEEAVAEALQSKRAVPVRNHPQRIFPDDAAGLVLPLGDRGALYVGGEIPAPARHLLTLLAGQGGRLLDLALRLETLQQSLETSERSRRGLQQWVEDLRLLGEGSTEMSSTLDMGGMLGHLQSTLEALCPESWRAVVLGEQVVSWDPPGDEPAALRLAQTLAQGLHPLLVEDLSGGALPAVWKGQHSLLAVPLLSEGKALGALLVGSPRPAAFLREQQDQLSILSFQAAVLLRNAGLHEDLQRAFQNLQESRAMLVQSSKLAAVGELAAGVAHELNTPLGTIMLSIDTAAMLWAQFPERAEKRLAMARREAERAHKIVEKLLYYSRDASLTVSQTTPRALVEDTLQMIGHSLEGVQVVRGPLADEPVWCNANEIQQVLINLMLNARDALQDREARCLTVRAQPAGDSLRFEVEDNGPGIPEDILEKIFDPFFTTRPVGKGTGLGLSISRQIVNAHRGELGVETGSGRGSTFWFTLPSGTSPVPR